MMRQSVEERRFWISWTFFKACFWFFLLFQIVQFTQTFRTKHQRIKLSVSVFIAITFTIWLIIFVYFQSIIAILKIVIINFYKKNSYDFEIEFQITQKILFALFEINFFLATIFSKQLLIMNNLWIHSQQPSLYKIQMGSGSVVFSFQQVTTEELCFPEFLIS